LRAIWEGNSCLLSPGAPDTVRCGFPSLFGEADRWQPWSRWRTGHCPVSPTSRWLGHVSRADRAADRWPGRPLAHRTVRCTPDSLVNYSRTPLITSREQQVRLSQPGTPDTVRCTTGQSGATRQSCLRLNKAIFNSNLIFPVSST
jgi:hypothetical protein